MAIKASVKRVISTMLAATLALVMSIGIAGCGGVGGNADAESIRASVTQLLDIFKNPTKENLGPYMGENQEVIDQLDSYGIDIYDFLQHAFSKYSYEVGSIEVDGDKATAAVTVSNANLQAAIDTASADFSSRQQELAEKYSNGGEDALKDLMKEYFDAVYKAIDEGDETVTTDLTLNLTKKDGEWEVDEDSQQQLVSAMYGGLDLSGVN